MTNNVVLCVLALSYAGLFTWAFRTLPHDGWQFLASMPIEKTAQGTWSGINLTYYGLFTASAMTFAMAVAIVLLGSLAVPFAAIAVLLASLLILTVPAARLIARVVEGKANTFTIGGAAFVGLLAAPWAVLAIHSVRPGDESELPMFGSLAVLAVAYALGEGTGRLACISFGCCYGKPLSTTPGWWRRLFGAPHFVFVGETKKAAYEGGLETVPVIPIQAITAIIFVASGLLGIALFLGGAVVPAFLVTLLLTQSWRVVSELFRVDYRGGGTLSAYQIMAMVGGAYGIILTLATTSDTPIRPDIIAGLSMLWSPTVIVLLQSVWVMMFLYTGRSTVTASHISFSVLKDRI